MTNTGRRVLAGLFLAALLIGACGGDDDDSAASESGGSTTATTAGDSSDGSGSGDCPLDAAAVSGVLDHEMAAVPPEIFLCKFEAEDDSGLVVDMGGPITREQFESLADDADPVEGVGDAAASLSGELYFLVGDRGYTMLVHGDDPFAELEGIDRDAVEVELAQLAVDALN